MKCSLIVVAGVFVVTCYLTAACRAASLTLPAPYDTVNSRYQYTLPVGTPFLTIQPTIHNDTAYDMIIFPAGHSGYSGALPVGSSFSRGPNYNETSDDNADYLALFVDSVLSGGRYYDVKIIPQGTSWTLDYGVWTIGPGSGPEHWVNQDFDIDGFWAWLRVDFAGATLPGDTPDLPLMPESTSNGFDFSIALDDWGRGIDWPVFIDPVIAVGYTYSVPVEEPGFETVYIPNPLPLGDGLFELVVDNVSYELTAGVPFDFTTIAPAGVHDFIIQGIDPVEALMPDDPEAFVTGLTFVGGGTTAHVGMVPITIPEPDGLVMVLLATGMFLASCHGRSLIRALTQCGFSA